MTENPLRRLPVDRPIRGKAARRADAALEDRGQRRLVNLDHDLTRLGQSAAQFGDLPIDRLSKRLGDVPDGLGIAESALPRAHLQRRRQRPGADHLDLHRPGVVLRLLLEGVEVLGKHRPRVSDLAAGRRREAPPRRGRLDREVARHRSKHGGGPADHVGTRSAGRQLGDVHEPGQLPRDDAGALPRERPREGPDGGGLGAGPREGRRCVEAHACTTRRVRSTVAEPITRVPSYTTTACPGARPRTGSASSTTSRSSRTWARALSGSP